MILLKALIGSFAASYAFGFMFNVKGKNLLYAAFAGALCSGAYTVLMPILKNEFIVLLICSTGISFVCEIMARIEKSPVTTFFICAVICLVPGGAMYYTMLEIIRGNMNQSVLYCLNAIAAAGAIALGVVIASTVLKLIKTFCIKKERSRKGI